MSEYCQICKKEMTEEENCGGDCLECMAFIVEDPDALRKYNELQEKKRGSMKFVKYDGGKKDSKRPKQTNSCTVVALTKACDIDYDTAYDILAKDGRKSGRGFWICSWCSYSFRMVNGYKFNHVILGSSCVKPNAFNFIQNNPKGKFIVSTRNHCFTIIDGVVYDHTKPDGDEEIYEYIEVEKAKRYEKKLLEEELKKLKEHKKLKKKTKRRKTPSYELYLFAGEDNEFGDCEFEEFYNYRIAEKRMKELIEIEPRRSMELRKLGKEGQIEIHDWAFYCGFKKEWEITVEEARRSL